MKSLLLVAASVFLVSCAPTPGQGEDPDARVFRTGSHLPVRDNQVQSVQTTQGKVINTEPQIYIPTKPSN